MDPIGERADSNTCRFTLGRLGVTRGGGLKPLKTFWVKAVDRGESCSPTSDGARFEMENATLRHSSGMRSEATLQLLHSVALGMFSSDDFF